MWEKAKLKIRRTLMDELKVVPLNLRIEVLSEFLFLFRFGTILIKSSNSKQINPHNQFVLFLLRFEAENTDPKSMSGKSRFKIPSRYPPYCCLTAGCKPKATSPPLRLSRKVRYENKKPHRRIPKCTVQRHLQNTRNSTMHSHFKELLLKGSQCTLKVSIANFGTRTTSLLFHANTA